MSGSRTQRASRLWLVAETNTKCLASLPTDFTIIDLAHKEANSRPLSLDADTGVDESETPHSVKSTTTLHVQGDTLSASQFGVLSSFFPSIKRLYIQAFVFEDWNNDGFPAHTTGVVELLVISDACGEYITAGPIVRGQIPHVVLYLTHSLQFEGAADGSSQDVEDISQ
ncbi:hypothetical protein V8F20_011210 [Naviculisporaceae sp. PSN 640]